MIEKAGLDATALVSARAASVEQQRHADWKRRQDYSLSLQQHSQNTAKQQLTGQLGKIAESVLVIEPGKTVSGT